MSTVLTAGMEKEDFFTRLSFSNLMCELGDKENLTMGNMQLHPNASNVVKFDREVERLFGGKSEEELINYILM